MRWFDRQYVSGELDEEEWTARPVRVDQGLTWRGVGDRSHEAWALEVGRGDPQSLGATMCHVAAELLGEDPDAPPWNCT